MANVQGLSWFPTPNNTGVEGGGGGEEEEEPKREWSDEYKRVFQCSMGSSFYCVWESACFSDVCHGSLLFLLLPVCPLLLSVLYEQLYYSSDPHGSTSSSPSSSKNDDDDDNQLPAVPQWIVDRRCIVRYSSIVRTLCRLYRYNTLRDSSTLSSLSKIIFYFLFFL